MNKFFATILFLILLMCAEYRVIMNNIRPYRGEGGTVYLEVFGMVDVYYAEPVGSIKDLDWILISSERCP